MKKKILVLAIAVALIAVAAIGGSLAWLSAETEAVENTFAVGNVNIELVEPNWVKNSKVVPGTVIDKDPTVNVLTGSETAYVYIKVVVPTEFADAVINYDTIKWTCVDTENNIWRCNAPVAAEETSGALFTTVTFPGNKFDNGAITALDGNSITVSAFAIQSKTITLTEADAAAKAALND